MRQIDVRTDVNEAAGLGESLETAATVCLPDELPASPVVCFGWPGGGYSRQYFTFDMPGSSGGGQAGWHVSRGWIFVACDHLYVGESSYPSDPTRLTYDNLAAANRATVDNVLGQLAAGTLAHDVPPLTDPFTVGIGQSMGGCLLIVQQGRRHTFDAVGVLGYSGSHTKLWMPPGTPEPDMEYVPRWADFSAVVEANVRPAAMNAAEDALPASTPCYHYDDVPGDIVAADMIDYPARRGQVPVWGTGATPPCAISMLSPGAVAMEAASITVPVFVGVGERDVCPEPFSEPRAYKRSSDVTLFICPKMAHMHNFASTREILWARLHGWAEAVAGAAEVS